LNKAAAGMDEITTGFFRIKSEKTKIVLKLVSSDHFTSSIIGHSYIFSKTISKIWLVMGSPENSVPLEVNRRGNFLPDGSESLIKSRQRVSDHGEVFTPNWIVDEMLNLVKDESIRIESRFLESACGAGNFLKTVLERKLETVRSRYGKSEFETRHFALLAVMSIYGIELLEDNIKQCREELLAIYSEFLGIGLEDIWYKAATKVLIVNIIQGDALTLTTTEGKPMKFPEWGYLGSGKYQRRDFQFDALTQRAAIKGTLFEMFEEEQLFVPVETFPSMSVEEMAK
jgi:hypothetical protein